MTSVDHAYQYSVEVKSRFSLFLDDNLNNEDPDLLLSKLQSQRSNKKDKTAPTTSASQEVKKPEPVQENEPKPEISSVKTKSARTPRLLKTIQSPPGPTNVEATKIAENKESDEVHIPVARGRGGPRGFNRGFRGRGQGLRPVFQDTATEATSDVQAQRDAPYEPRGRGRGRGRGGFNRGRAAYTDVREFDRQGASDRMVTKNANRRNDDVPDVAPDTGDTEPVDPDESQPVVADGQDEHEGENEPAPEEPKCYTLEEYKAMRSAKQAIALHSKSSRKANDGKDVFANMVPHRKINEVSDEEVEEHEKEPEEEQSFEINVTFTDRHDRGRGRGFGGHGGFERGRGAPGFRGVGGGRPRGGRGARGGFRGDGRGTGYGRGMAFEHQAARPVIYSDQDFPSLK